MRIALLLAGAFAAMAATGPAFAQKEPPVETKDTPVRPLPEGVAKPLPSGGGKVVAPATARVIGCVSTTIWNTAGIDYYSNSFSLKDSSGAAQTFAFAPSVLYAAVPGSLPLASRADSEKWRMVIESVERAAVARRQLMVDYETVSRRTFGVVILWDQTCP